MKKRREWGKIKRNGRLQNERLKEEKEEEDWKQMKKMTEKLDAKRN